MSTEKKKFSLKDHLFNRPKVEYLAGLIKAAYPEFEEKKWIENILEKFPELELKERIFWIEKNISDFLPNDYLQALDILLLALPPELDPNKTDDDFGDFIFAPLGHFVAHHGCNKKYLQKSFAALAEMNKRFSTEFEIRDFFNAFEQETFDCMLEWSVNTNYHLRRLASEGSRPSLPWAKKIDLDYKKTIQILDNLFYDSTRYVIRSVANHLNDISKIDKELVIETLKKWQESGKQTDEKEMNFLISHSLRTLIKKGDANTLLFLGYNPNPQVKIEKIERERKEILLGESLCFSFEIMAKEAENLIIDYKITYPLPSGKYSKKVFKIKKIKIKKGEKLFLEKKHAFRKMTTKKLYSGEYRVEIQINGKIMGGISFFLTV